MGQAVGLDRIPEVRTLRRKLEILCRQTGLAMRWNTELAREWIAGLRESEMPFFVDGHVRVYNGDLTALPRHHVARQRLCLRATTDYWINLKTAVHPRQPRPAPMFTPPRAVLRNHPLGEVRSSCAAQ